MPRQSVVGRSRLQRMICSDLSRSNSEQLHSAVAAGPAAGVLPEIVASLEIEVGLLLQPQPWLALQSRARCSNEQ